MAYKINSFNYEHVRSSIFRNGIAATSKAYGINKNTLKCVKENATFDQYREYVAQKSREQYEKRLAKQRKRMFGDDTPVKNGLRFNGEITLNKPKEELKDKPFNTSPELGISKTIVTEVKEHARPADLFNESHAIDEPEPLEEVVEDDTEVKTVSQKGSRGTILPSFTEDKLNTAIEMARNGELKTDIARKLGYKSSANLTYHITRNPKWADAFNSALADGKAQYRKNLGKRIGGNSQRMEKMRNASNAVRAAIQAEKPTVDKTLTFTRKEPARQGELTSYERGLITGAKKMGMTLEEYQEWRKEKLAEARKNRWVNHHKKNPDKKPEKYKDLVSRQEKEKEDAKNSQIGESEVKDSSKVILQTDEPRMETSDNVAADDNTNNEPERVQEAVNTDQPESVPVHDEGDNKAGKEAGTISDDMPGPVRTFNKEKFIYHYSGYVPAEEKDRQETEDSPVHFSRQEGQDGLLRKESTARGWNSLLISIGQAVKIIAIGGLMLLLAQAAATVINSVNSSDIKIDASSCEYTKSSWGIEVVKCSTI